MDFNNLNSQEVEMLIKRLKYPDNLIDFETAYQAINTLFGKVDVEKLIIDDDDIEYILRAYRGKIELNRFSIHIRFKNYHHHLVRVDFNPGNIHINPDGKRIKGSHIHIYNNEYDKKDQLAIPIDESDFPNVNTLIEAYIEFLTYTNIQS